MAVKTFFFSRESLSAIFWGGMLTLSLRERKRVDKPNKPESIGNRGVSICGRLKAITPRVPESKNKAKAAIFFCS